MSTPLISDRLWEIVAPLLPPEPPKPKGGRPRVSDRAALTDEGITAVTASPTVTASSVRFDGLADSGGKVQLVATTFTLDIKGATAAGPLAVQRSADLTFAPAAGGIWLITAYRVAVVRQEPDGSTTTTTTAHS